MPTIQVPVKIYFSAQSTGRAILSQGADVVYEDTEPNTMVVEINGIQKMTHTVQSAKWIITDVDVNTSPTPVTITMTSQHSMTYKTREQVFRLDLSSDPTAQITITLSYVAISATEYDAPALWVKGPDDEQDQYRNPGQWYFDTDGNHLEIFIP